MKKPIAPSLKWERARSWAPLVMSVIALFGLIGGLIALGGYLEIIRQHGTTLAAHEKKFEAWENAKAIHELDKRVFAIELTMKLNSSTPPSTATTTPSRSTAGKQR